jgi:cytochrome c-type biogenesis protein CcmH/NrfF
MNTLGPGRILLVGLLVVWAFIAGWAAGIAPAPASGAEVGVAPTQAPITLEQRRASPQTSVEEVAPTLICPTCDTTLDASRGPAADRMRVYVEAGVAAGWTAEEIRDGLVAEYGGDESVLASPRATSLLGGLAWVGPGIVMLGALIVGVVLTRRWRRAQRATVSSTH